MNKKDFGVYLVRLDLFLEVVRAKKKFSKLELSIYNLSSIHYNTLKAINSLPEGDLTMDSFNKGGLILNSIMYLISLVEKN